MSAHDWHLTFNTLSKYSLRKAIGRSGREVHSWTMQSFSSCWMLCFCTYCSHSLILLSSSLLMLPDVIVAFCPGEGMETVDVRIKHCIWTWFNLSCLFWHLQPILTVLSPYPTAQPQSQSFRRYHSVWKDRVTFCPVVWSNPLSSGIGLPSFIISFLDWKSSFEKCLSLAIESLSSMFAVRNVFFLNKKTDVVHLTA